MKYHWLKLIIPFRLCSASFIPKLSEMDCLHEIEDDCQELATESQSDEGVENKESNAEEGQKWWDSESQNMLSSQQLVEALTLCDDILYSQSPSRDGKHEDHKGQPGLGVYADLGPECLKKDIEECQRLVLDPSNIVNDNPAEIRLSQLVLSCSQILREIEIILMSF